MILRCDTSLLNDATDARFDMRSIDDRFFTKGKPVGESKLVAEAGGGACLSASVSLTIRSAFFSASRAALSTRPVCRRCIAERSFIILCVGSCGLVRSSRCSVVTRAATHAAFSQRSMESQFSVSFDSHSRHMIRAPPILPPQLSHWTALPTSQSVSGKSPGGQML